MNTSLADLFRSHGLEVALQDDKVVFPNTSAFASAVISQEKQTNGSWSVQLDVEIRPPAGYRIFDVFAGLGSSREEAVSDALGNFAHTMFHVVLCAFFDLTHDSVTEEKWLTDGKSCRAFLGLPTRRGILPEELEQTSRWFDRLADKIREHRWRPGAHWINFYYAQMQGKEISEEVLVDQQLSDSLVSAYDDFSWPRQEGFYSLRLFLILRIRHSEPVTPVAAVSWLAEIVSPLFEFTQDDIYDAIMDTGVSEETAGRAYRFTQAAWSRAFLAKYGVQASDEYASFNAEGDIVEEGNLSEEPYYAAALALVEQYAKSPGYSYLVSMSGDYDAFQQAVSNGAKSGDLRMAGLYLLDGNISLSVHQKIQRTIQQRAKARVPHQKSNPWWKFWK